MPRRQLMPVAVTFQGGIVLAAFALGWFAGTPFWTDIGFTWTAAALGVACTLPLIAGALAVYRTDWPAFRAIRDDFNRVIDVFRNCTVLDVAILSLLAGVGEEALFRGVLQNFIEGFAGPTTAIFLASALFGVFHPISRGYVVGAAIIGAYLGGLYLWTDNLLVPMLVHGLYDFVLLVYAVRVALPGKVDF